jgi:dTMP kinase
MAKKTAQELSANQAKLSGFIVFEGVNGGGKSSLIKAVSEALEARQHIVSREPGATPLGVEIRALLLAHKAGKPSPTTELLLFSADRSHHVDTVVTPALNEKKMVLCDRYFYSTLAFQGYGRGIPLQEIETISQIATKNLMPDFVVLLDLDPATGLRRTKGRTSDGKDAFEDEELAFHTRLRNGFLTMAETRPEPFFVIDANKPKEAVFDEVISLIKTIYRL